jgi:hypothetical protein
MTDFGRATTFVAVIGDALVATAEDVAMYVG